MSENNPVTRDEFIAELRRNNRDRLADMLRADASLHAQLSEARATIDRLTAHAEGLRKDAERYHYLRDGTVPISFDGEWWTPANPIDGTLAGPTLDTLIDAALAHSTPAPVNEEKGE